MSSLYFLFLTSILFYNLLNLSVSQLSASDLIAENAEEIANKTYVEEQSELQRFLFKNYNRKMRPLRNQSLAIQIGMHIYIMHYAVNQIEQTITVNGHIYMTWEDEVAVWDPASFNNVRSTIAKQWDLWQPDLRVANSVSGVNQYFEISKRSHTTLTSITPTSTKVEVYPTFAVKIGCHFDYSDYPFDEQHCAMRLYTTQLMSEIELHIYYGLNPSVMLGWGEQAAKRHINDWELVSVHSNLSYYTSYAKSSNKQFINERPSNADEAQYTWTLVLVWIELRRNANLFWTQIMLPMAICTLLNAASLMTMRIDHALIIVIINIFMQNVCISEILIKVLPPAVGTLPQIGQYANVLLVLTCLSLLINIATLKFDTNGYFIRARYLRNIRTILEALTPEIKKAAASKRNNNDKSEKKEESEESYTSFVNRDSDDKILHNDDRIFICAIMIRNLCAIIYMFIVICITIIIFLF